MPKHSSHAALLAAKRAAADAQHWLCCYCTLPMWEHDKKAFARTYGLTLREANDRRCTAEHVIAKCDGGTDDPENIAAACETCNRERHAGRSHAAPEAENYLVEVMART